ncbi:phosphoenolpyruvate synthase [Candidatus Woesearchaeota archaeon]|nr:phosphoenolpyruvate synthase [Candidatus Woesearchaeota archaeon]
MSYVAWFKDLDKDSLPIAGGKGTNLGIMYKMGFPVPNGFCVTAQTYKEYLERTGITNQIRDLLHGLDRENTEQLQATAAKIQELIVSTPIPDDIAEEIKVNYELLGADRRKASDLIKSNDAFVAVRSSATAEDLPMASFAGQQATFLNVKGEDNVVAAVLACWASLFTARALYYREKNQFDHMKVFISAVVQRMVDAEKSGIMFTVNPATNSADEMVIEAIYGLGELIVGGEITPDMYLIDKKKREIKKIDVRKKTIGLFRNENGENERQEIPVEEQSRQVLNDAQIKELARLGAKLEEHYQLPQDVEWAVEQNRIYLVQTRAVTTFKPVVCNAEKEVCEEEAKILLRGETASSGVASGAVRIVNNPSELSRIQKGDVLVTVMTTPDMVPAMQKAAAIVTDEGGLTCHAAIVSREMGTPCLVGTEHATELLKDGQIVTVHATRGIVYNGKVEIAAGKKSVSAPSVVRSGNADVVTATEIKVILDLPDLAGHAAATGADGVGLVRSEIMIANGGIHPAEYVRRGDGDVYVALLKEGIRTIARAFAGKPVWIRCSDMRSDEYRSLQGGDREPKETDPMIGWHGIRRLLDETAILKAEFQAIRELHYEGLKNIGVMLPFVIRVEEVRKAKEIMREVGLEPCTAVDFGVMVETPAACWIIEDICKEGISFVSFGTNDLTQLTLGIDRNNQKIASLFDEMHPAVLGEIAKVIKVCKKYCVKTSICGQAGSRPEMAEFLVHQGIDSISSNVDTVDEIRRTVARVERKLMLEAERHHLT